MWNNDEQTGFFDDHAYGKRERGSSVTLPLANFRRVEMIQGTEVDRRPIDSVHCRLANFLASPKNYVLFQQRAKVRELSKCVQWTVLSDTMQRNTNACSYDGAWYLYRRTPSTSALALYATVSERIVDSLDASQGSTVEYGHRAQRNSSCILVFSNFLTTATTTTTVITGEGERRFLKNE